MLKKRRKQSADSIQSIENRNFYKTEEEKRQLVPDSFKLNNNEIWNADKKLKEGVIKFFVDNFGVLTTPPSQYGETEVLQKRIDLIPCSVPYKSQVRPLNPDQKDNLRKQINKW